MTYVYMYAWIQYLQAFGIIVCKFDNIKLSNE